MVSILRSTSLIQLALSSYQLSPYHYDTRSIYRITIAQPYLHYNIGLIPIIFFNKPTQMQNDEETDQITPSAQSSAATSEFFVRKKHPPTTKRVKINTSHCRGELRLVKAIILENNWVEVFKGGDILWSGLALPQDEIFLATEMKVNRIPAMPHLCHKRTLGFILNKFRQYWPNHFYFYPKTYLLPEDQDRLQKKIKKGGVFIAKPSAGCQGDGIVLIRKLADIPKIGSQQWIVQPYIDKPLLLGKKKFDLRLYVLIASVSPYICYLNEEGLARFCVEDYQEPTKENFNNAYIHLTNYSLNKNHPNFESSPDIFSKGAKRCLKVVWEQLKQNGIDVSTLREKIEQLTQKFLTGLYPFLKYYYNATFPKRDGKCFHVLGIDILIDDSGTPWLLQSNNNPSFNIQHQTITKNQTKKQISPVDEYVKKIVMEDALFLVRRSLQKQKDMQIGEMYYSYKKILDLESEQIKEMNMIQNMLSIFHSQCSIRSKWVLTSSQFTKLANFPGMTSPKVTKNDYHLIFIKIMRKKTNPNQMSFEDFIEAMEHIVNQILGYTKENKLEVMQNHIDTIISHIQH